MSVAAPLSIHSINVMTGMTCLAKLLACTMISNSHLVSTLLLMMKDQLYAHRICRLLHGMCLLVCGTLSILYDLTLELLEHDQSCYQSCNQYGH